jgi:hypothetical protein
VPFRGSFVISVKNVSVPYDRPDELFYSNNPERLTKFGQLYAGKTAPGKCIRLLYHHQNAIGKPTRFVIEFINSGSTAATFRILRGTAQPMVDTVDVGYIAGAAFMKDNLVNGSFIQQLPASSRLIVTSETLRNNETVSGILQVSQQDGEPAYIRISSLPPDLETAPEGAIAAAPNPFLVQLSNHVYPSPVKALEANYEVGGKWAFISIGRHAIKGREDNMNLAGNYGVSYVISVNVKNPTDRARKITVLFEATAGLASGAFIIDGKFVSVKYARSQDEIPLVSFEMLPGQSRQVRIVTLPLAGSNYPAQVIVRS